MAGFIKRLFRHLRPQPVYLATYGNAGLEVTFFRNQRAAQPAIEEAEQSHYYDQIDSYVHGEVPMKIT